MLQNVEHVITACVLPGSSSVVTVVSQSRGDSPSLVQMVLKTWCLGSSSSLVAVGANPSLVEVSSTDSKSGSPVLSLCLTYRDSLVTFISSLLKGKQSLL